MKTPKTITSIIISLMILAFYPACTTDETSSAPLPDPDPVEIKKDHLIQNSMERFFPQGKWEHRYTDEQLMSSSYEFDFSQEPDSNAQADFVALYDFLNSIAAPKVELQHSDDAYSRISQSQSEHFTIRWTWDDERLVSATLRESKSGWVHSYSTAAEE